jgi:2-aminobenzoate-CoA ligase
MAYSAHVDSFARDRLPPAELWPEFLFELPELTYPERLNCATELLDKNVLSGNAGRPVLHASVDGRRHTWSYRELLERADRIANVLVHELGMRPGNRVLLRSPNNPMLAACLFAVLKAGGIIVPTMPLLRSRELSQVLERARVGLALCDPRLRDEMACAAGSSKDLKRVVYFDDLETMAERRSAAFTNVETAAEDIAMIAFTSGTTGVPKAVAHFHRDVMAMCDAWPRSILQPDEADVFCGTPPLAFTYGLGIMLCIPMRFGASTVLIEKPDPAGLLQAIQEFGCTVVATAPTFYRRMAPLAGRHDLRSLRKAVSSGEVLPDATRQMFRDATGIELIDGLGCTEMMQTFLSHTPERARRGATGYVIPGYRAEVLDADGKPCPPGVTGRLAVKGASGCLYLADERQASRVEGGWYITGDAFSRDEEGYFYFHGRTDELIVSAGYNISPLDVESALLEHEAVAECAVSGVPDAARGQIVCAFVVLKPGYPAGEAMSRALQDFVKGTIAPYKYPRRIEFVEKLPRTETGKLQRFKLTETLPSTEQTTALG